MPPPIPSPNPPAPNPSPKEDPKSGESMLSIEGTEIGDALLADMALLGLEDGREGF